MSDIIHFHKVTHRYQGGKDILSDVTFTLARGEMAFLTGPSGSGKTTLMRLVSLLERPLRGQIIVGGQNLSTLPRAQVSAHRQDIGLIFQNFSLLYDRSVYDNVAMPLLIRGFTGADIGRRVRAALDAVGLLPFEKSNPITLSGGEQQRVGIARAIVARPSLLLADEPTGNLDPRMAREVMELFRRFNEVGVSILIATHAVGLIQRLPYRILHLEHGSLNQRSGGLAEKTVDFG